MTAREWQPGDVVALPRGQRAIVDTHGHMVFGCGDIDNAKPDSISHDDARPLVVIDPEDRVQVERLWQTWRDLVPDHRLAQDNMQAALREFANPTPPKPAEPLGFGAQVLVRWDNGDESLAVRFRISPVSDAADWCLDSGAHAEWKYLPAVRVLSEGVTS